MRKSKIKNLILKTAFSNKTFDYIAARLPLVMCKSSIANTRFVEENKLGISIDYNNVENLREILEQTEEYKNEIKKDEDGK